jgi:PEP-CTERM motif
MFKKLIIAAAIAAGSFGAQAAPVDTNFYSDLDGNASVNLQIGSFSTAAALSDVLMSFSLFTLSNTPSFSSTMRIALTPTGSNQALGTGSYGGAATYTFFGVPVSGHLTNFSASFTGLTSGLYNVNLIDTNYQIGTPVASTNFSASVTAVPEPETYAMLLAGLGAVGFLSRRRKAAQV